MTNLTFWGFLALGFEWISDRATRILGVTGGTLAVLQASNVIPDKYGKYCMAAIAVFTYWRGQTTANTVATAKAIVNQTPVIIDKVSPPPDPPASSKP